MSRGVLRIATRGSNLALWQAEFVAGRLRSFYPKLTIDLVRIATEGDRATTVPLAQFGGLGVFTREIQLALLNDRADLAVHSLKDLPTEAVEGITLAAIPERASPYDALVLGRRSAQPESIRDLPPNARVGTGSHRRRAQILHVRPDIQFLEVRGNVETRLRKLDNGEYDALILAEAGLERLGLAERISCRLEPPDLFPAVGQGALGIECRVDAADTIAIVAQLNDASTWSAAIAERQILARLKAGCHAPVGVATSFDNDRLAIEAVVLSRDGKLRLHSQGHGTLNDPAALGRTLADDLLGQGAAPLIEASRTGTIAPP